MSGRVDHRERRRVSDYHLRQLAKAVRTHCPDLESIQLPDFNLDTPGLMVELINTLVGVPSK